MNTALVFINLVCDTMCVCVCVETGAGSCEIRQVTVSYCVQGMMQEDLNRYIIHLVPFPTCPYALINILHS